MYSIYKYRLCGAELISADVLEWLGVGLDLAGEPCVWARVDVDSENKKFYRFNEIETGWVFDDSEDIGIYLGTLNEGPYVWHYFAQEIIPTKHLSSHTVAEVALLPNRSGLCPVTVNFTLKDSPLNKLISS